MKKKKKISKNSSVFLEENNKVVDDSIEEDIAQSIDIVNRNKEELNLERNKRINKFERNANGKMIERPEIRYKVSTSSILIVCAFIILITWIIYDYGPIFGIHVGGKNLEDEINSNKIELVTKDNDIYGEYNDNIYVFSNSTITGYNENGEVTWNHMFSESFTPSIYVKDKYMLVTNNSTGAIYLFENQNEILNKKIDGVIKNAFIDSYGNIALEYTNSSGYNKTVSVYDKNGNTRYDAHLTQEVIISLELLDNANKIIFTEAMTNSTNIGVKFRMVDVRKKESEQIRDIASLENQFVYNFKIQGKYIYALLDNKIVSINIDNGNVSDLKEFDSTQMIFVALNDNYYTYLEKNISDNKYVIKNVNYNGVEICTTSIDSIPKSMVSSDFVNYYIFEDHVYLLNKWGVDLGERKINFTPKQSIVFNNNKSLALIYTNKIYIVNL